MNVDRFGRRPLFLISAGGMCFAFVCWTICGAVYENSGGSNTGSGYAQLVFIWLFSAFYDMGFSGLLIAYALEILPFHLRAKGMMIMNITVQAVLALGNQTNQLAWINLPHHWNFMLFYTVSSHSAIASDSAKISWQHMANIMSSSALGFLRVPLRLLCLRRDQGPDPGRDCPHLRRRRRHCPHQHPPGREGDPRRGARGVVFVSQVCSLNCMRYIPGGH